MGMAVTTFLFLMGMLLLARASSYGNGFSCSKDTLEFGVCGSWLGLLKEVVGTKPSPECCTLLKGLADLEAAACLCTAIKADVLGVVKVKVPVAVTLLLNACGNNIPHGFVCK